MSMLRYYRHSGPVHVSQPAALQLCSQTSTPKDVGYCLIKLVRTLVGMMDQHRGRRVTSAMFSASSTAVR
jgi:hypothetical protein